MKRITFKRSHSTARKIEELFQKFLAKEIDNQSTDLTLLVDLVKIIRPYRVNKKTSVSIKPLLDFLKNNEKERVWFSEYLKTLLSNRRFSRMISDAGILQDSDFMYEVRKRLWAKLLP
jgi:site-specific recombinase